MLMLGLKLQVMAEAASEIRHFLQTAEATTVQNCPLTMRTGMYNRENVFLYYLGRLEEEHDEIESLVMNDVMVQMHR